jgi:hypothetical protein
MPSANLPLLAGSRTTACWAQLLPTCPLPLCAGFLGNLVPDLGVSAAVPPQILTPITGKGTAMRINVDQGDGVPQWKWQSEPSGKMPPSTGMGTFPFSK